MIPIQGDVAFCVDGVFRCPRICIIKKMKNVLLIYVRCSFFFDVDGFTLAALVNFLQVFSDWE